MTRLARESAPKFEKMVRIHRRAISRCPISDEMCSREKEKTEGVQLDDEKAKIKGFIKAAR
jgi:hypothetical protein